MYFLKLFIKIKDDYKKEYESLSKKEKQDKYNDEYYNNVLDSMYDLINLYSRGQVMKAVGGKLNSDERDKLYNLMHYFQEDIYIYLNK